MLIDWILTVSAYVALLIPIVFIRIRESTKLRRGAIVQDLASVFDRPQDSKSTLIPSFEFVKYKYFVPSRHRAVDEPRRGTGDFQAVHWILGSIPIVLLLFVMNAFSAAVVLHTAFKQDISFGIPWLNGTAGSVPLFAWAALSSYAGGLLFTLRAFNQAINNFDLSPLSLVGATVNLAFGNITAALLVFVLWNLPMGWIGLPGVGTAAFSALIVTAFAAGYYPDVAMRYLFSLSRLRRYKTYDGNLYGVFKAIPIDIIDGIDTEIRSRLADYHINAVQNLAAANPLMLFVETPYGVYQIMDWVAQAQLCASVGPNLMPSLWRLGIRTIFDLERITLDPCCRNEMLLKEVGAILWRGMDIGPSMLNGQVDPETLNYPDIALIEANLRFRLESPHVHRLRQIFNRVSESLGEEARRLPPVLSCPAGCAAFGFRRG